MSKIVALDLGARRTGMAETDPMRMMAFPLTTVDTTALLTELESYVQLENPEVMVIGDPGEETDSSPLIREWTELIKKKWPHIEVVLVDESGTSQEASQALIKGGMKKSKRREKGALDKVAAALILERYLAQL